MSGRSVAHSTRPAGWATAALFVAVFPANLKMAADTWPLARLPVQIPLVSWAVSVAREGRR